MGMCAAKDMSEHEAVASASVLKTERAGAQEARAGQDSTRQSSAFVHEAMRDYIQQLEAVRESSAVLPAHASRRKSSASVTAPTTRRTLTVSEALERCSGTKEGLLSLARSNAYVRPKVQPRERLRCDVYWATQSP
mmetsp:Transcript_19928/g.38619  ORF Transcript_19928/g.38619 Transcript_19928/m.38619 type:complete len:136 (-) Transcript_19928:255-662(-)